MQAALIQKIINTLKKIALNNIDVLTISGTKIDNSIPIKQICVNGYCSPYHLARKSQRGGILI